MDEVSWLDAGMRWKRVCESVPRSSSSVRGESCQVNCAWRSEEAGAYEPLVSWLLRRLLLVRLRRPMRYVNLSLAVAPSRWRPCSSKPRYAEPPSLTSFVVGLRYWISSAEEILSP